MKRWMIAVLAAVTLPVAAAAQGQMDVPQSADTNRQQPPQQHSQSGSQRLPQISAEDLRTDQIRELQQALNMKGFDAGHADGVWGPQTQTAVRNFQQAQGLEVTGQPDRKTIYALGFQSVGDEGGTVGSGGGREGSRSEQKPAGSANEQR